MVNVFALFWKTLRLLKLKKSISFPRGRTLSGHTWSTMKKFSILNLSSLYPYGKPYLGYTARRWFTLLGDGSRCSATAHNWSATHHGGRTMSLTAQFCPHLLGQAQDGVAQRVQGARGLAVGGYDPGYPRQTTWATPSGAAQPTRQSLTGHDSGQRLPQDNWKIF